MLQSRPTKLDTTQQHTTERPSVLPSLLTEVATARALGLSLSGLRKLRMRGEGPRFVRCGLRAIRYREDDVHSWLDERSQQPCGRRR
jgi:predicted DNA-binding transcriptional regulator AlpA